MTSTVIEKMARALQKACGLPAIDERGAGEDYHAMAQAAASVLLEAMMDGMDDSKSFVKREQVVDWLKDFASQHSLKIKEEGE